MKIIIDNSLCCGCHSCINACPKQAITMTENNMGFKYPSINQDKCIDCNMCKKVCPILNNKPEQEKKVETYACFNTNTNERLCSSSGGIFILLAKEIIKKNGVVFGAVFDNNFAVKHSFVENEKDLVKFMGSKYTQSIIGDSFKKVEEFLNNDRYVLFTGTPCQIEGLKTFLKKDYDKLYTQDIICHGVPSPRVWKKYLDFQRKKNDQIIKDVSFRNKDNGWSAYQMKLLFETKEYSKNHSDDLFMKAFLGNICLRESCYNCSFKKKHREADITLGDYWGINNIHPEMNDDKGISILSINSNKGKELFELIKGKTKYLETKIDDAIEYNSAMVKPVNCSKHQKDFEADLDNMDFQLLINKYFPKPSILKRIYHKTKCVFKKTFR